MVMTKKAKETVKEKTAKETDGKPRRPYKARPGAQTGRLSRVSIEEAARVMSFAIRPLHFYILESLAEKEGVSRNEILREAIEAYGSEFGLTQEKFKRLRDKSKYMKGILPSIGNEHPEKYAKTK
jgi:hypothetical protein